jgi:acyl carrier protein
MTMHASEIERRVRQFIADNFLFGEDGDSLTDSQSLLEAGLIDSTGILQLVAFLESDFGISVADAEIVPDNLDAIRTIVRYVGRKSAVAAAPTSVAALA